jgi:hypothetical protein
MATPAGWSNRVSASDSASNQGAGLLLRDSIGATFSITNSTFNDDLAYGVRIYRSSAQLSGVQAGGTAADANGGWGDGLVVVDGAATIDGSSFDGNARCGVTSFGVSTYTIVALSNTDLRLDPINLDEEGDGHFENLGNVTCTQPGPQGTEQTVTCVALSSTLKPPSVP